MGDSGSKIWVDYNLRMGYDGTSKWTKADFEANFGKSPAEKRRSSTPTRTSSTDTIPF